jgi:hypothetical protein
MLGSLDRRVGEPVEPAAHFDTDFRHQAIE